MVSNNDKSNGNGSLELGRPTLFTEELAVEICLRLSEGESLRQICRDDHMPHPSTVIKWAVEDRDGFNKQYVSARAQQVEHWADEIIEISDDGTNDWMERETKSGRTVQSVDHEYINRSKLRVDTRKWLMERMAPKRFGPKVQTEIGGTVVHAVKVLPPDCLMDIRQPKQVENKNNGNGNGSG